MTSKLSAELEINSLATARQYSKVSRSTFSIAFLAKPLMKNHGPP